METETTILSEFSNGGEAIVEEILASEEINPKEQDYENHSRNPSRKVEHLGKVKIITDFTRSISSTKASQPL